MDKVFVTGCLSERYKPDLQKEIPHVDQYFWNYRVALLLKALGADYKHRAHWWTSYHHAQNYAYLKIAEGCDRPCSFCAIPLMQGQTPQHTDWRFGDQKLSKIGANGVKELILIAQDLTYYGLDLYKRALADLLQALVKVEGIEWIRLHYAFPTGFPWKSLTWCATNLKYVTTSTFRCSIFPIPFLSPCVGGQPKRRQQNCCKSFRDEVPELPSAPIRIVGYPGETEADFQLLKDWVAEMRFERLGCFTHSHEENTHAFHLEDDVPRNSNAGKRNHGITIPDFLGIEPRKNWAISGWSIEKRAAIMWEEPVW